MTSPRVLLLVTGGISAYKSCLLARLLVQAGFAVKVAMTEAATRFVTPLTFQVLTGHPVASDLWGEGQSEALDHIEYARWADLAVVAPATANTLAKAAHGIADGIVTSLLLAFPGPVLFAPAMNDNMWRHPATQANLEVLRERQAHFVGPGSGDLACGTVSEGRMAEPEEILAQVRLLTADLALGTPATAASGPDNFWQGRQVVITAGPTHEPLDPVRYLANRSSGAFGYALARQAVAGGAQVVLISGPVQQVPPRGLVALVRVESARDMSAAVGEALEQGADWLIMAAAVADFAPDQVAKTKLKKEDIGQIWGLTLKRNPDILGEVVPRHRRPGLKVVGFALETEEVATRAAAKLQAKELDYIVANDPTAPDSGFGDSDHAIILLGRQGELWTSPSLPKDALAWEILQRLAGDASGEDT